MFESLRDTLISVQNELSSGVEKLRLNVAPSFTGTAQRCPNETINEIVNTQAGSELLLRYQDMHGEMSAASNEGIRLANLCSTRMGRAQQMCTERADSVLAIDTFLRGINDCDKKIHDLNRQVDKLVRFCDQTELAMTHLEALHTIVRTEAEVDMIRQQTRTAMNIVSPGSQQQAACQILQTPALSASDKVREKQEEVMLEEFLSSKP